MTGAGPANDGFDADVARLYGELQRLARRHLNAERPGHTLDSVALVSEAYERLNRSGGLVWESRPQFFSLFSRTLRRVLADYARARLADKRGGGAVRLSLSAIPTVRASTPERYLDLENALERLGHISEEAVAMVEARFFLGLTTEESAEAIGLSVATARRRWQFAKMWLERELGSS